MRTSFLLFSIFLPLAGASAQVRPLVITDATVIDVRTGRARPHTTVVVRGDRISAVGRNVKIPGAAQVVNASGKFLIPGLWDMHTHAVRSDGRTQRFWLLFRAHGIVGTREMGSGLGSLKVGRDEVRLHKDIAPRLVVSSPMLDGDPPTYENYGIGIADAVAARRVVRQMKADGYDLLKVYNGLSRDAFFALADEARRINIPIAGEVPDVVEPAEAARAGMRSFEHLWNLFESCVPGSLRLSGELKKLENENATTAAKRAVQIQLDKLWLSTFDQRCFEKMVADVRQYGTWQTPTLAINRVYSYFDEEPPRVDERRRWIPPKVLKEWYESRLDFLAIYGPDSAAAWRRRYQIESQMLASFAKAGVGILAGSDATNGEPFIYPGSSLHDELALMVDAGLTPLAALQSATINPARFLRRQKDLGSVESGKIADLVILDANPVEDIENVRKIHAVVFNGRSSSRSDLNEMLKRAESLAKTQ